MRDEQRDRMLIEIARALEILLAEMARQPTTNNTADMIDHAATLADARMAFEQHYV
jgi:hypothetical protein